MRHSSNIGHMVSLMCGQLIKIAFSSMCDTGERNHIRGSIVVSISACHAEDPGSIPGRGVSRSMSCVTYSVWYTDANLKTMLEVQQYNEEKQLSADVPWKKQCSFTKPDTFSVVKNETKENTRSRMYTWPGSTGRSLTCRCHSEVTCCYDGMRRCARYRISAHPL